MPPDHAGITQQNFIDQFQKVAPTLKSYIDHQHPVPEGRYVPGGLAQLQSPPPCGQLPAPSWALAPCPRFLYTKLLLMELQTLKVENTRQIVHIQDLSSMMPLFSEIG